MTTIENNHKIKVTLLGVAQDGGVPQCGCSCPRCMSVLEGKAEELYPVALGITDLDGKFHLIEASRMLTRQLHLWGKVESDNLPLATPIQSVTLTHIHLGHVDGLGLFGKEVMGKENIPLYASEKVLTALQKRSVLSPFQPHSIQDQEIIQLGKGVSIQFLRVPHRDHEDGNDMHAILIHGVDKKLLFLPDHDYWSSTLQLYNSYPSLRGWLKNFSVDIALIDGTFFDNGEVSCHRGDGCNIPHPTIMETLVMLQMRSEANNDPDIYFIHLNHTNPVIDNVDKQQLVHQFGWKIGKQGQVWNL